MLARIALASNALELRSLSPVYANPLHRQLIKELMAHGKLVFGSDSEFKGLLRAIRGDAQLPQDARKSWNDFLIYLYKLQRISVQESTDDTDISAIRTLDELRQKCRGRAEIAVLGSDAALALGIPEDRGFLEDRVTPLEIATAASVGIGPTLSKHHDAVDRGTAASGSSREEFWRNILRPMAEGAREAVLLDGYLFQKLWDIEDRGRSSGGTTSEHVVWLLRQLDTVMAPGANVIFLSKLDRRRKEINASAAADILQRRWNPPSLGRLGKVTLFLSATAAGNGRFPHDRHIRFNCGVALEVSAGFDRLSGEEIWDPDGMKWHYRWQQHALRDLKAVEERARALVGGVEASVLERP